MHLPPDTGYDSAVQHDVYPTVADSRKEFLLRLANAVLLQEQIRQSVAKLTGRIDKPSPFPYSVWKQTIKILNLNGNKSK